MRITKAVDEESSTAYFFRKRGYYKVLLARHTYGKGAGKLIIPGGYVEYGETE